MHSNRIGQGTTLAMAAAIAAGALLMTSMGGCATKRTVPPTDGKAMFDTSLEPVPELCVIAINEGHKRSSNPDDAITYNLPRGLLQETWLTVDRRLPPSATPMHPGDTRVVSVEELRIDGGKAEVDVLVPLEGQYQLYTLHCRGGGLGGWKVTFAQPWTLRTEVPTTNNPWAGQTRPGATPTEGAAPAQAVTTGSESTPASN
jgi:hypothetical protein